MLILPDGTKIHEISLSTTPNMPRKELGGKSFLDVTGGKYSPKKYCEITGAKPLEGYQLRYIYFLDKSARKNLTVAEIPFSKIDELNAGMYKGKKISVKERHVMR